MRKASSRVIDPSPSPFALAILSFHFSDSSWELQASSTTRRLRQKLESETARTYVRAFDEVSRRVGKPDSEPELLTRGHIAPIKQEISDCAASSRDHCRPRYRRRPSVSHGLLKRARVARALPKPPSCALRKSDYLSSPKSRRLRNISCPVSRGRVNDWPSSVLFNGSIPTLNPKSDLLWVKAPLKAKNRPVSCPVPLICGSALLYSCPRTRLR